MNKDSATSLGSNLVNGFKKAFPVIVLIVGLIAFTHSIWGDFPDARWKEFYNGIGKLLIVSSVFTFLVKWLQFSGIIKDEITKFIFEPKFLSNRKDLSEYWEKVSKELFDNKFPEISKQLLRDIKGKYMPTDHLMYYEQAEHTIDIKYTEDGFVEITQTNNMIAIPKDRLSKYTYDFGIVMPYLTSIEGRISYDFSIKINQKTYTGTDIVRDANREKDILREKEKEKEPNTKVLVKAFKIELNGSEKYEIERTEIKKYNIHHDGTLYFCANRMYNKLKVDIHYPKNLLTVDLKKCGTLDNFVAEQQTTHSTRYVCKGIIYPEQGYYINVRPKIS